MLTTAPPKPAVLFSALLSAACVFLFAFFFRNEATALLSLWQKEEYSHAFLVVPIGIYWILASLLQRDLDVLPSVRSGIFLVAAGLAANMIGVLITSTWLSHSSILVVLAGLVLLAFGPKALVAAWKGLFLLLLVIPLPPQFMTFLTAQLQIMASALGTLSLHALNIPVFREGNVIDLGTMKLQVVEACSGLHYLFPLLCFCFLAAFLFNLKNWVRFTLILSSIPIAVFANALRITAIGLTVTFWGREAAEGIVHLLEGFAFFFLCLLMLVACLWFCLRASGTRLSTVQSLEWPRIDPHLLRRVILPLPTLLILFPLLLVPCTAKTWILDRRASITTPYSIAAFPLNVGPWHGRQASLPREELDALRLSNYFMADYVSSSLTAPSGINFYVAYYANTQLYNVPHSPLVCLPGSGWEVLTSQTLSFHPKGSLKPLHVNRLLVAKGPSTLLVYYWWRSGGYDVASTFAMKGQLLFNAINSGRSDVALVRVAASVDNPEKVSEQDETLQTFITEIRPDLDLLLPSTPFPTRQGDTQ